ncbi:scarecrow-like protein 33 [Malania oleifera]|uniref:scarecrow-like protein 33 n=1 Tax=Malania oleifera TaxID=397392 RepID=UPI0025ADCBF2|nr:scarecrow-like protein 33 [Malania oleifera]
MTPPAKEDSQAESHLFESISKDIVDILMNDDIEEKLGTFVDPLALRATEKSFYEVLGKKYPPSPTHLTLCNPVEKFSCNYSSSNNFIFQSTSQMPFSSKGIFDDGLMKSSVTTHPFSSPLSSNRDESILMQFRKREEKAHKYLPVVDFDSHDLVVEKNDREKEHSKCTANEDSKNNRASGLIGGKDRVKKRRNELVDLRDLLISCAEALAATDITTTNKLLKEIRQHSSYIGDASQRMAHYFANALEARLAGTGAQICADMFFVRPPSIDMLKFYRSFSLACPFGRICLNFANQHILDVIEKGTKLHIIDFGITFGFQWTMIVQDLLARVGGTPNLRITGIEPPQDGPRTAQRIEETRHCVEKYFEQFNISFEYNVIAKKWDSIQFDDIKINKDEVIAVNCLFQLENRLPDDTVALNSPRNIVLDLIRKINPKIFIHAIRNGSFNVPFFVRRFQKTIYHYSAWFDMMDKIFPRENSFRLMFEQEMLGQEVVNIIACEGLERIVRFETYKHWQARNTNAGFKQLPLSRELMKRLRTKRCWLGSAEGAGASAWLRDCCSKLQAVLEDLLLPELRMLQRMEGLAEGAGVWCVELPEIQRKKGRGVFKGAAAVRREFAEVLARQCWRSRGWCVASGLLQQVAGSSGGSAAAEVEDAIEDGGAGRRCWCLSSRPAAGRVVVVLESQLGCYSGYWKIVANCRGGSAAGWCCYPGAAAASSGG